MSQIVYRYEFDADVAAEEIEASLLLAVLATESLHGEAQTRLDAAHCLDPARRACVIEADTLVGRDINRLFVAFLRREFGADSFHVRRISEAPAGKTTPVAA